MIHGATDSAPAQAALRLPRNWPNCPASQSNQAPNECTGPSLLAKALDWQAEGRLVALATVIQTWGSAPQPVGSQLVIDADGNFLGSVSGGCVEAEVITEAIEVIATAKPKALEFGVEDDKAWSVGLACGGAIRIFVEPLAAGFGAAGDSCCLGS